MNKKLISITLAVVAVFLLVWVINSETLEKPKYEKISLQKYEDNLSSGQNFMIYVYKASCVVCQEVKPFINEVIETENVNMLALDADEEGNLNVNFFKEHNLEKSPTILYYEAGQEKDRLEGYQTKEEIREFVTKYIKS
ncbi:thioredoxin family protein [Paenibacillus amylolyticus]|uniref:thioredoxin family protein n=1 Tax=Paenibacillus TaxID=44249 RepID=UPI0025A03B60|nr:thioredoxin family protein [Paenibacillus sp. PK1-4R]WJM07152.1 thioredoxin family protein [Paenibacillus sp. PK1-4R]